ncbi:MAG: NUDIX hydrolase [uncultured bacterium]|nr:MAG: NUDIX hydrolase [uncultured bacterium]
MNNEELEILKDGQYLRLLKKGRWEFVERKGITGIVVIIAITHDNKIILTEQFRPPVNRNVIELPAGLVGDIPGEEHESLETAAKRELLEETGYKAGKLTQIFQGPPSAGLSKEIVTFFLATDLVKDGHGGGDETEDIIVHSVKVAEFDTWINNKINEDLLVDPKIYAGLYFSLQYKT